MSGRFDEHTAVRVDDQGGLHAEVDASWSGYFGAHGGYMAAIALRALMTAADAPDRRPRSLDVHLLEPAGPGPVWLEPRVERTGGTSSTASVRVRQSGRTAALATASFAATRPGVEHFALPRPAVPGPEDSAPLGARPVPQAQMMQYVEHRPAAEPLPFAGSERAEISVWMRLTEERPVDSLSAAFLVDAAVPALYAHLTEYVAMPTTQLTIHFARPPKDESPWVLGVFRTLVAADGHAVEDGELWTPDGTLLLTARQLRRVLVPRAGGGRSDAVVQDRPGVGAGRRRDGTIVRARMRV